MPHSVPQEALRLSLRGWLLPGRTGPRLQQLCSNCSYFSIHFKGSFRILLDPGSHGLWDRGGGSRRRTGSSSIRGSLLPECRAKAPPWVAGGRAASGAALTRPGCAAAAAAGRALLGPLRPWCVLLHSNRARALRVLEVAGLTNRPFPRSLV